MTTVGMARVGLKRFLKKMVLGVGSHVCARPCIRARVDVAAAVVQAGRLELLGSAQRHVNGGWRHGNPSLI